jgi:formamidopyrimidine-DNA glycosylase
MIGILRYMPELPEVETIKRRLQELLPGKKISQVNIFKEKSFGGNIAMIINQEILKVSRKAKILRFHLPNNLNILTHLKMTGQLIYVDGNKRVGGGHPTADFVKELPSAHTRISYLFDNGSRLFFNDQRMFGWMRVLTDQVVEQEFSLYGPDITDEMVTAEYLQQKFKTRSLPIKQAIMDHHIMAGVGNIYACDALNVAQLSPFRPAKSLSFAEIERLSEATKLVINEGIEAGGTTFDGKYVNVDGLTGSYQHGIRVYGREGKECYQCGGLIVKTTLGGRGTYYCSSCQQ